MLKGLSAWPWLRGYPPQGPGFDPGTAGELRGVIDVGIEV